jgi:hypothetical protein
MNTKKLLFLLTVVLAGTVSINTHAQFKGQELDGKDRLEEWVEDGDKLMTVIFQDTYGNGAKFDCSGWYVGFFGGMKKIHNGFGPYVGISVASEGNPTYQLKPSVTDDGRKVRHWRHALSWELALMYGRDSYVEESYTQGKYNTFDASGSVKWRVPGLDEATMYRVSISQSLGIGAKYTRYDSVVDGTRFFVNGFAMYVQSMTEIRVRPFKNLALAVFSRGGIIFEPRFAMNEAWKALTWRVDFIGVQVPLAPHHTTVRAKQPIDW